MDEIPSTEFRKTYATLREPVAVTVNGHVIGQWIPAHSATYVMGRLGDQHTAYGLEPPRDALTRPPRDSDPIFRGGTTPTRSDGAAHAFRPVPKPSQRK